jgi:hypothetical protein
MHSFSERQVLIILTRHLSFAIIILSSFLIEAFYAKEQVLLYGDSFYKLLLFKKEFLLSYKNNKFLLSYRK